MAVERAERPGRPEEEVRAAAEAWGAFYEEGTCRLVQGALHAAADLTCSRGLPLLWGDAARCAAWVPLHPKP